MHEVVALHKPRASQNYVEGMVSLRVQIFCVFSECYVVSYPVCVKRSLYVSAELYIMLVGYERLFKIVLAVLLFVNDGNWV